MGNLYQVPDAKPQHTRVCSPGGLVDAYFLLCENSIAYQVLHTPTLLLLCCVGVAHPDPGSGRGVLLLSKRYTLETLFIILFLFLCTTHAFVCVLWLESLILAQDERWRRA